ncbi:MAG: ester cyclase [Saprospiraceae bacterium]|nr:ester cyclase [Saprospiraceae bacterium]
MSTKNIAVGILAILLTAGSVYSQSNKVKNQKSQKMKNLEAIVLPFYQKALTVNTGTNPADVLNAILADGFVSHGTIDNKDREQLIGQLGFFWKMIPDLKWEPEDIIESGNQVIVRSKVTGTPNSPDGKFFGVPTDGTKSFQTMSIDIHTIESGKIVKVDHIEDWATAIKQVSAK